MRRIRIAVCATGANVPDHEQGHGHNDRLGQEHQHQIVRRMRLDRWNGQPQRKHAAEDRDSEEPVRSTQGRPDGDQADNAVGQHRENGEEDQ